VSGDSGRMRDNTLLWASWETVPARAQITFYYTLNILD
jgi:hypothetical protein